MDTILMRAQIAVSGRYYFMVMDIPIDAHMDGIRTDAQTLLQRCEDASKKVEKK